MVQLLFQCETRNLSGRTDFSQRQEVVVLDMSEDSKSKNPPVPWEAVEMGGLTDLATVKTVLWAAQTHNNFTENPKFKMSIVLLYLKTTKEYC